MLLLFQAETRLTQLCAKWKTMYKQLDENHKDIQTESATR